MAELRRIKETLFFTTEIVEVNLPVGKAVGAKDDACSDNTKAMLIQPNNFGNKWEIEQLRRALNDKLDNLPG